MSTSEEMSYVAKWIVFIVVVLLALTGLGWAWKYSTAPIAGKVAAEVMINSGDSRINNYEHFFNQCAAIQGYEAALVVQQELLKQSTGDEAVRTRANIAGISAQRARAIVQYNVDASKTYTKARFFDDQLPLSINPKEANTKCVH